jgi:hypothetical protein
MFGGEFSNPNGEKFRHFNDFWRFDLETNEWQELATGAGVKPSPRSGHRMVVWKNFIVLFGGFYDTYSQTRYFNDVCCCSSSKLLLLLLYLLITTIWQVWVWHMEDSYWIELTFASKTNCPPPRSGCQLVAHESQIYMIGGYSKESAAKPLVPIKKKAHNDDDDVDDSTGVVHSDIWALQLTLPDEVAAAAAEAEAATSTSTSTSTLTATTVAGAPSAKKTAASKINIISKWEQVKRIGNPPSVRSSFSLALQTTKKRAIVFGGVHDASGWDGSSTFYNDMYVVALRNTPAGSD